VDSNDSSDDENDIDSVSHVFENNLWSANVLLSHRDPG
jgi:hypothetical protein